MTTIRRPHPARDPDTWGFFEAAARGELVVNACSACGAVLHLPRPYCHRCGSLEVEWRPVSGRARLVSWTTVHQGLHPAFDTPYTVVLVELDDAPGARLAGYLPGEPDLADGMAMEVRFEPAGDDVVLPQWEPVGG
jgi:hypothetical protein